MDEKRPTLRIVSPEEVAKEEKPTAKAAPVLAAKSKEGTAFTAAAETLDVSSLLGAAYLACAGCYLTDAAIAFYHQAASHAPSGTFRHDIPPGLKAAEATRAWLGTHLSALKKAAGDSKVESYDRGKDLIAAAVASGEELERAEATAKSVGLWYEERRANLFKDALEDLTNVKEHLENPPLRQQKTDDSESVYALGCDVLGGLV